jgi:hypothetical protein
VTARAAIAAALIAVAGCSKAMPAIDSQEEAGTPSQTEPNPITPDHLAPGELLEGPVRVFGLALPSAATANGTFVDVAYVSATASVQSLARYFRARVNAGTLRESPSAATFEHVKVPGKPGMELLVRITAAAAGSNIEIRDTTPPVAPALPDEQSRWRQVGITPQGRLADPTHLD